MAAPPIGPAELEYAVLRATPAERRWFADILGSGWIERHGIDGYHAAGLSEALELAGGGRNRRFNGNERRIRDAALTLMTRYPMGDPFAPSTEPGGPQTSTGAPLPSSPAGGNLVGSLVDQLGGPVGVGVGLLALFLLARKG